MRYYVEIIRNYYGCDAVRVRKQADDQYFTDIDTALITYNASIIGEKVSGSIHSNNGSSNIHVSLNVLVDGEVINLESVFIHNGEVQ